MLKENIGANRTDFKSRLEASVPILNRDSSEHNDDAIYLRRVSTDGRRSEIYRLTSREFQVLLGIIDGLTNQEIGEKLYISKQTVKNHSNRIFFEFDSRKGRGQEARNALIAKLVNEGVLGFKPRIPEEDWVGIRR